MNSKILNPLVLFPLSVAVSCTAKQGMMQTSDEMPITSSAEEILKDASTDSGESELISNAEEMWNEVTELYNTIVAIQDHLRKNEKNILTTLQSGDVGASQTTIDDVIDSIGTIRNNYGMAGTIMSDMEGLFSKAKTADDAQKLKEKTQTYHEDWAQKQVAFQLWDLSFTAIHLGMWSYIHDMNWCKQYHKIQADLEHRIVLQEGLTQLNSELKNDMFEDYHKKSTQKLDEFKNSKDSETKKIVETLNPQIDDWVKKEQSKVEKRKNMLKELKTQFQFPASEDEWVDCKQPECMREAQKIWKECTDMFSKRESYQTEYDAYVTKLGISGSVDVSDATMYTFTKDTFEAAGGNEAFTSLSKYIEPNYRNIEEQGRRLDQVLNRAKRSNLPTDQIDSLETYVKECKDEAEAKIRDYQLWYLLHVKFQLVVMSHIYDWDWLKRFKKTENRFKQLYELYNKNQITDKDAIKKQIDDLQKSIGGLEDDLKSEMYLVCHRLLTEVFPRVRKNEDSNITKIIQEIEEKIIGKALIEQFKQKKQGDESTISLEIEQQKESARREMVDQLNSQVKNLTKMVQDLSI